MISGRLPHLTTPNRAVRPPGRHSMLFSYYRYVIHCRTKLYFITMKHFCILHYACNRISNPGMNILTLHERSYSTISTCTAICYSILYEHTVKHNRRRASGFVRSSTAVGKAVIVAWYPLPSAQQTRLPFFDASECRMGNAGSQRQYAGGCSRDNLLNTYRSAANYKKAAFATCGSTHRRAFLRARGLTSSRG